MSNQAPFRIRAHRSLVDVAYRVMDTLAVVAAVTLVSWYSPEPDAVQALAMGAATLLVFAISSEVSGLYRSWRGSRFALEAWCVGLTWMYAAPITLGLGMLTRFNAQIAYESKVAWLAATPVVLVAFRLVFRELLKVFRRRGYNTQRFAVCGINNLGLQLVKNFRDSTELGMDFAGYFDDRPVDRTEEATGEQAERRGDLAAVVRAARAGEIQVVFITFPMRAEDRIREFLRELGDTTASVYIVPDFFVFQMLHARWNQIDGLPVVSVFETPISGIDGVVKRGFDLTVSLALLILLSPVMSVVALLVKRSSPGPVFYRQKRYGLMGEEIRVWKFRSMRQCDDGTGVVKQATKDDDRVTRVGRVLRASSLDELPQLFNVVEGSMSLVGPRPHATAHNEQYRSLIDGYMLRHKVKPGITGLAQVNGARGETETLDKMQRRVEFDHRYIREWSLWMDIKILLRTAAVVLRQENAY